MTEYHDHWTSIKELSEELGRKIGESIRATDCECEANWIKASDNNIEEKRAGASDVAWEKFLTDTFLLR